MDAQAHKSSWWWYVLLGLIVFIVIILIIDKKNRGQSVSERQNMIIEDLRARYEGSMQATPEEQNRILTEVRSSSSSNPASSYDQDMIIQSIRENR